MTALLWPWIYLLALQWPLDLCGGLTVASEFFWWPHDGCQICVAAGSFTWPPNLSDDLHPSQMRGGSYHLLRPARSRPEFFFFFLVLLVGIFWNHFSIFCFQFTKWIFLWILHTILFLPLLINASQFSLFKKLFLKLETQNNFWKLYQAPNFLHLSSFYILFVSMQIGWPGWFWCCNCDRHAIYSGFSWANL